MKRKRSSVIGVLLSCLAASTAAFAQPDIWNVDLSSKTIYVHNIATGVSRFEVTAPSNLCLSPGAMSDDRRWYFVATNVGIARIDVAARRLLEFTPRLTSCPVGMWVSPSGRWWHVLESGTPPRYITIDAVTKAVASTTLVGGLLRTVTFDVAGARRYELSYVLPGATPRSLAFVTAYNDGPASTPLWNLQLTDARASGGSAIRELAVGPAGVYVLVQVDPGSAEIRRFDLATGAELGRSPVTFTSPDANVQSLAVYGGRVYVTASSVTGTIPQHTLLSVDAITLADRMSATPTGALIGQLHFDAAANVGYVIRTSSVLRTGQAGFQSFDPATLALNTPVFTNVAAIADASLGALRPPGAVRLDAISGDQRASLTWQPDAATPPASEFEVRGAARGQPLQPLAVLDGHARTYVSPPLPQGSYAFEVIGRNVISASTPARADIGIDEQVVPGRPENLVVDATDTVARLRWQPPSSGAVPSVYYVEARVAGSSLFFAPVLTPLTDFFTPVPPGRWEVRIVGRTPAGFSNGSNIVLFTSRACVGPPSAPTSLVTMTGGQVVTLQWTEPASGLPSTYVLEVGSYPGRYDLGQIELPGGRASLQTAAPAGTYNVRVRARNACGDSAPSNEAVVFVP